MRINKLEELRKIHSEIRDKSGIYSDMDLQNNETMVMDAIKRMIELNNLARYEGLLALEEAVIDIPLEAQEEELKQLIILLVDGTDPEVIQGIGLARYYSSLYTDYQALRYFIYLEGVLSIQAGDNPRILEEKLKVFLPHHMYLKYSLEQEQNYIIKEKKEKENLIENLCKGERLWNKSENGYYVSRLVDYVICDITDKELQRVMRDVDNMVLTLAMKGMSGEARKHIFNNVSQRLGKMLAEDMVSMGPVRIVDVLEASQTVLNIIIRLIDNGDIAGNYEYLEPFYNVFNVDIASNRQKDAKLSQLREMVEEYEQAAALVREFVEI